MIFGKKVLFIFLLSIVSLLLAYFMRKNIYIYSYIFVGVFVCLFAVQKTKSPFPKFFMEKYLIPLFQMADGIKYLDILFV